MKSTRIILPLTIIAGLTTPLFAQDGEPREPRGHPPVPPLIRALDRDEDGVISKYELRRAPKVLAKLDENNDGELTRDELRPPHPEGNDEGRRPRRDRNAPDENKEERGEEPGGDRPGPPPSPIIGVLDADHDGTISEEEIENASEALAQLDTNEDGELTRDELRPPRPDGPPPGEGDGEDRPGPPRPPRRGPGAR